MSCTNPIADQILPSALGQLSSGDEAVLGSHLGECADCQARRDFFEWIVSFREAGQGEELFAPHIETETLVAFAESPRALTPEEQSTIEDHLALCRSCRGDVVMVRTASIGELRESRPTRWALAAILLILLVPSYLGLQELLRPDPIQPISRFHTLAPAERSGGSAQGISGQASGPLALQVEVPISDASGIEYRARIEDRDSSSVWPERTVESVDEFGRFVFVVPSGALPTGEYRLLVTEWRIDAETPDTEFVFAFRVE